MDNWGLFKTGDKIWVLWVAMLRDVIDPLDHTSVTEDSGLI